MTVSVNKTPDAYRVEIDGVIKSVADSQSIKDAVNSCDEDGTKVVIDIVNSFSITSSVIGYLLKKVQADKMKLEIIARDDRLKELFKTLNLVEILNVRAG